jgi:predicted outer membrane protein
MSRRYYLLAFVCVSCVIGAMFAQEGTTRPDDKKAANDIVSAAKIISPIENDRKIAQWIMVDVQGIVDCSKQTVDRTSNETVKQFAQTMINEHKDCLSKLEQIASREDPATRSERNPPIARIEDAKVNTARSGVLAKDEGGQLRDNKWVYRPTDFVEVKKDVCEKMKEVMMKEMKQLPAAEYDSMYLKHMVAAHEAFLASCQATRSTASKEMQAHLDQNVEKLNNHLKQARELCKQVSVSSVPR